MQILVLTLRNDTDAPLDHHRQRKVINSPSFSKRVTDFYGLSKSKILQLNFVPNEENSSIKLHI